MDISKSIPSFIGNGGDPHPVSDRPGENQAENFSASIKIALGVANAEPCTAYDSDKKAGTIAIMSTLNNTTMTEDNELKPKVLTLACVTEALELIRNYKPNKQLSPAVNREPTSKSHATDTIGALCILTQYLAENYPLRDSEERLISNADPSTSGGQTPSIEGYISARNGVSLQDYLDAIERSEILSTLEKEKHNKTQAARTLGISFRSLRYRLDRLMIE